MTGQYSQASDAQKQMLRELLGKDAEYSYELYFHWYNVIHELGHAVMMFNSPARPHPADEEQLVNNFAVAYWRQHGKAERLAELVQLVEEALGKLIVPAQDGEDHLAYAKPLCYTVRQLPAQVVADAVQKLRVWGVKLPDAIEVVFCDDVNCQMCQAENIENGEKF